MQVYNYASFARAFEKGMSRPNMTEMAKSLFEPIVSCEKITNRAGNPYVINSKYAADWYNQKTDIPKNIKEAANIPCIYNKIGKYFSENILDNLISQINEDAMYEALLQLISDSDLPESQKNDLKQLYDTNELGEFLGKAFLYAIVRNNKGKIEEKNVTADDIEEDIRTFEMLASKYRKPNPIRPPKAIAEEEIKYVNELYQVYGEKNGKVCNKPEDLEPYPKLKNNFTRQRKNYYLAETIRRGLRDTVCPNELGQFDLLKDEVYEGVIETEEKDFPTGFDRLTAVMEHAAMVNLSKNTTLIILNWVGPGEKKGICHMLVNEDRLRWMGNK